MLRSKLDVNVSPELRSSCANAWRSEASKEDSSMIVPAQAFRD